MKPNNELVISDLTHERNAESCEYLEKNWESSELKAGNVKENLNGGDGRNTIIHDSSAKGDPFEKDSVFFMDKSVMECEMPEIVVCYKESTYHVVKDICVDEGVPLQDKFLFDCGLQVNVDILSMPVMEVEKAKSKSLDKSTGEVEEQSDNSSGFKCNSKDLTQKGDVKEGLTTKIPEKDRDLPTSDVSRCIAKDYGDMEVAGKCDSENLIVTGEVKNDATPEITEKDSDKDISIQHDFEESHVTEVKNDVPDKTADNVPKESLTLGDILSMENNKQPCDSMNYEPKEQSTQSLDGNRSNESATLVLKVEDSDGISEEVSLGTRHNFVAAADIRDGRVHETNLPSSVLVSGDEEKSSGFENLSSVSTSRSGLEFESVAPSSSGKNEDPQKHDPEQHVSKRNSVREDSIDHTISGHFHNAFGETSFSAAGPVSGLITYSGPITYAGSLSVRSDSSTTSTRSFAFPVLQTEWNSSPVRMAKAERRLRRHKGWKQSLCCCRF